MSVITGIFTFLKFLPELIAFTKLLGELTEKGIEKIEIMNAMKKIKGAFDDPNPISRARKLNDIFR